MRTLIRNRLSILSILTLGFLTAIAPARGDQIIDGNFSNGLSGWSVSDPSLVAVVNNQAVISESAIANEVDLYQVFTIPTGGAASLTFTLDNLTGDAGNPVAAFGASLIDPILSNSLLPTVDMTTDSFYTQDVGSSGLAASGVTLSPVLGSLPLSITVDTSSLAAGTQAEILFRLISGQNLIDNGSTNATATLENVFLTTSSAPVAVPEPSAAFLFTIAATCLGVYLRPRNKRLGS